MDTLRADRFESHVYNYFLETHSISISHYHLLQEQIEIGENRQGIEIKNQPAYEKYKNLYISVKRVYSYAEYPSGLYKDNHWLYVTGVKNTFWIFSTKQLKQYYTINNPHLLKGFTSTKEGTEYGFLLTSKQADDMCIEKVDNQLKLL